MSKTSKIGWTHHTSSPWFVCTEVDECCANCYAREWTKRNFQKFIREAYRKAGYEDWETLPVWGNKAPRVVSRGFWKDILKWNADAKRDKERRRTFTSLMDWLDDFPAGVIDLDGNKLDPAEVRARYLRVIQQTPDLDHLLLTKRPELWRPSLMEAADWIAGTGRFKNKPSPPASEWWQTLRLICNWLNGQPPDQVWFGYTAGTRETWKSRYEIAKAIPARILWVSAEPLLEDLDFIDILQDEEVAGSHLIDWIVPGGESGKNLRNFEKVHTHIENLSRQARACGCKVYVKQDANRLPGQQGRICQEVWEMKEYPV